MKKKKAQFVGNLTSHIIRTMEEMKKNEKKGKKDLDNSSILCDNSYFKSSLMIISDNKFYSCKAYLDRGAEKSDAEKVIDSPEFYKEIEFFKIFNYGN